MRRQNESRTGFYTVYDNQSVKELKEDGYILPLNGYIENNTNWKTLPDDWKSAFSLDGQIWALPYTFRETVAFRYIRSDWLKNLKLDKPTSIDEFYETMQKFTYDDPDKDEIDNTYGVSWSSLDGLADIFNSFDARLNYKSQAVPSWNPNSNMWEDSFLKVSFSDCLDFLKTSYNEKLIAKDYDLFSQGYSGSVRNTFGSKDKYAKSNISENRPNNGEPEIDYIIGLTHYIDNNVTGYYTEYMHPMVLTKNSSFPTSSVNILINNFMSNYNGNMLARFGIQEYPFEIKDNLLIFRDSSDKANKIAYPRSPNIIGNSPHYEYSTIYNHGNEDDVDSNITHAKRIKLAENNSLCYKIPSEFIYNSSTADMGKKLNALADISRNIINNIILGNISYDEGLESYRNSAKQLRIQEFLDMQNGLLGKTSIQHY